LSSIRILIADDYEGWRRKIRRLLQVRREYQVVGEALDGAEAVHKAQELNPDLILLDIGLRKLNGIEAAHLIRQLSPSSKILVVSQNNDLEVVRAALSASARGYVLKADARSELLPAMEAVLQGKQFISNSLKGDEFINTSGENAPHRRHEVLFYSDDAVLLDGFARFIADALNAGNAAIVLATKAHQDSLLQRLKARGVDTDVVLQQGTYVPLDVADALSKAMVDGLLDSVRYLGDLGGLIEAAAKAAKSQQPRVVLCGEGASLMQAEGKADAAIWIERGCNDLAKTHEIDILCAYPLTTFHDEKDENIFQSICAEHSAVYRH